mgnify:CR=1 FL=1
MAQKFSKILILLLFFATSLNGYADKNWQPANPEKFSEAKVVASGNEIEIRTQNGAIIVSTNTPTQIKVFTILGQLISQENLPAGVCAEYEVDLFLENGTGFVIYGGKGGQLGKSLI